MINRRQILAGSVVGAASLMLPEGLALAQPRSMAKEVLFDPDIPVLGNPNGDVTIVEFFDYQCSYCKWGFPDLMNVVERDGKVRLVMKDWPIFGEASAQAAGLVLAARETGQYAEAMRALMANRQKFQWYGVEKILARAGLDPAVLKGSLHKDAKRIQDVLARNYAQARAFHFRGTPSFIIGSAIHPGMMREQELVKAIAAARAA